MADDVPAKPKQTRTWTVPEPEAQPSTTKVVKGTPMPEGMQAPAGSVRFEHVCCKAVRPNPEEEAREARKEPYLEHASMLRPSAYFGAWVTGIGVLGIAAFYFQFAGLPIGMLIMVMLAALFALYLVASFVLTDGATRKVQIEGTRHVIEPKLERGRVFHTTLDTQGTTIPGGLRATITDQKAPGLRPVEDPSVDGVGRIHFKVRPQARGLLTFSGLDVRLESKNGLWVQDQKWRLRTTVEVDPSTAGVSLKNILNGFIPFGLGAPESLVKIYRDVEYEEVREYQPGDRMKDIQWKRMAINDQMIVRKRWSESETSVLLLFDLTSTMLQDQAGFRNIDHAVELAHEFAEEALRRNHEVGLLAFDEERIVDHVRPTRKKTQLGKLVRHLEHIADHRLPDDDEEPIEINITGDPENLRMGLNEGLKQRQTAKMTIILFSDLRGTPEEIVQGLSKAAGSGQQACVILLPAPTLKPVRAAVKGAKRQEEDDREMRGEEHTKRMRELLKVQGVDFLEAHPRDEELELNVPIPDEIKGEVKELVPLAGKPGDPEPGQEKAGAKKDGAKAETKSQPGAPSNAGAKAGGPVKTGAQASATPKSSK